MAIMIIKIIIIIKIMMIMMMIIIIIIIIHSRWYVHKVCYKREKRWRYSNTRENAEKRVCQATKARQSKMKHSTRLYKKHTQRVVDYWKWINRCMVLNRTSHCLSTCIGIFNKLKETKSIFHHFRGAITEANNKHFFWKLRVRV